MAFKGKVATKASLKNMSGHLTAVEQVHGRHRVVDLNGKEILIKGRDGWNQLVSMYNYDKKNKYWQHLYKKARPLYNKK